MRTAPRPALRARAWGAGAPTDGSACPVPGSRHEGHRTPRKCRPRCSTCKLDGIHRSLGSVLETPAIVHQALPGQLGGPYDATPWTPAKRTPAGCTGRSSSHRLLTPGADSHQGDVEVTPGHPRHEPITEEGDRPLTIVVEARDGGDWLTSIVERLPDGAFLRGPLDPDTPAHGVGSALAP